MRKIELFFTEQLERKIIRIDVEKKGRSAYLFHDIPHFLCWNMVSSRKAKYWQDCHVHILSFTGSNSKSDGWIILRCSAMYTHLSDSIKYVKKQTLIDYHQYKEDTVCNLWCRSTPDTPSSALPISQDQTMSKDNPKFCIDIYTDYIYRSTHMKGSL
jgi:hypothetical protein